MDNEVQHSSTSGKTLLKKNIYFYSLIKKQQELLQLYHKLVYLCCESEFLSKPEAKATH